MKKFLLLAPLALLLGACEIVSGAIDTGREYGGKGAAAAVEAECALSADQRAKNLEAVNNALAARGMTPQLPLDCNGDGVPDDLS